MNHIIRNKIQVNDFEIFPQTIIFKVLSWKKGMRRAGWVAHGSELGARARMGGTRIGTRGSRDWIGGPRGWHA